MLEWLGEPAAAARLIAGERAGDGAADAGSRGKATARQVTAAVIGAIAGDNA